MYPSLAFSPCILTSQGEMRYVITDTTNINKHPLAIGVNRSISQDTDGVDADHDDICNRTVIVSCPDDDSPSLPPSPTASMGDADFSPVMWLSSNDDQNTSRDSGPYVELDLIRKCPQHDASMEGEYGWYMHRPSEPTKVYSPVERRKARERLSSSKSQPAREEDEAEYASFDEYTKFIKDTRIPSVYSDPQWVSLLQSIRSFDARSRPKTLHRQSSYMARRPTMDTLSRSRSRKIRNEFIFEGKEKSVDDLYSTLDDIEEQQEKY
ncbi:hypothetical protein EGW08_004405 [Elysia chlorotica]|uniref:Uncharacterized protein n=1 Tax=Elysia chlorotica TaxID=188477 RepID=A0A433U1Y5_ELYCH|nr:hypothetical protein EGW08_004405 [Elysia chlorotica]